MTLPNFTQYGSPDTITGAEILLIAQIDGPNGDGLLPYSPTVAELMAGLSGVAIPQLGTNQFYADRGAVIDRLADRVLIGGAVANPSVTEQNQAPTDWLTALQMDYNTGAWMTFWAQLAVEASHGNIAVLGASRSSDAAAAVSGDFLTDTPTTIGLLGIGIQDNASVPAWGIYSEGWLTAAGSSIPHIANEFELFSSETTVYTFPYTINAGGGTTVLRIGAGAGHDTAQNVSVGIDFVSNPASLLAGIIFGATSLVGTNGDDSGFGAAVVMAKQHALVWQTPEEVNGEAGSQGGFFIRSQVSQYLLGSRLDVSNDSISLTNHAGSEVLGVGNGSTTPLLRLWGATQDSAGTGGSATLPTHCTAFGVIEFQGQQYGIPLFPLS